MTDIIDLATAVGTVTARQDAMADAMREQHVTIRRDIDAWGSAIAGRLDKLNGSVADHERRLNDRDHQDMVEQAGKDALDREHAQIVAVAKSAWRQVRGNWFLATLAGVVVTATNWLGRAM